MIVVGAGLPPSGIGACRPHGGASLTHFGQTVAAHSAHRRMRACLGLASAQTLHVAPLFAETWYTTQSHAAGPGFAASPTRTPRYAAVLAASVAARPASTSAS